MSVSESPPGISELHTVCSKADWPDSDGENNSAALATAKKYVKGTSLTKKQSEMVIMSEKQKQGRMDEKSR